MQTKRQFTRARRNHDLLGRYSQTLGELMLRKYTERAIRAARAEAELNSRSKSAFLSAMSHELRTPLNAIIGFSDIISREVLGPIGNAKYCEYGKDINDSGSHLLSIINDILDLAKAESGKLSLLEEETDILACVEECLRTCRPTAEAAGVALDFADRQDGATVMADRRLLFQIILNLTSNAVKFTPRGGRVEVAVTAEPGRGVTVCVTDTGIGIPADNIERVMRPFEQVENTYARSHGGTGLGLPYSAKLAELHDGAIRLQSEEGQGTTATLWLPPERVVDVRRPLREAS